MGIHRFNVGPSNCHQASVKGSLRFVFGPIQRQWMSLSNRLKPIAECGSLAGLVKSLVRSVTDFITRVGFSFSSDELFRKSIEWLALAFCEHLSGRKTLVRAALGIGTSFRGANGSFWDTWSWFSFAENNALSEWSLGTYACGRKLGDVPL